MPLHLPLCPHGRYFSCKDCDQLFYAAMFEAGKNYAKQLEEKCLESLLRSSHVSPSSTPLSNCVDLTGETKTK